MLTTNQQMIALGTIRSNVPNVFNYTLTNTGSNPIKITRVAVGCGSCTQASCSKTDVEAGGTTIVNVIFTPNNTGIQTKSVNIDYVDSGKTNTLNLKFNATVHG